MKSKIIEYYNNKHIESISKSRKIQPFRVGDTIDVKTITSDSDTKRIQSFEGVVIAKRNRSISSSFIVRKISYGEGINKKFMLYSPNIKEIKVIRHGSVRRAKLYFLNALRGKAARIKEKITQKKVLNNSYTN